MQYNIKEYENFLGSLILNKSLFRVKTVEFDLKGELNPTNDLNLLFFKEEKFLGFKEFYEYYIKNHKDKLRIFIEKFGKDEFLRGLEARLYRTQFGFLTEYHAYFKCLSIFPEGSVLRNGELDKKGVDFQIKYNQELYNIHVFVDTERARKYREYKRQNKHVDDYPGIHVNFPYYLQEGKVNSVEYLPNGFGIYTEKYINYLKESIESGNLVGKTIVGVDSRGFIFN